MLLGSAGGQLLPQGNVFCHQLFQLQLRLGIDDMNVCRRLLLQQGRIVGPLLIIIAIAISHKIQEDIKILQAQRGLLFRDSSPCMRGSVAGLADIVYAAKKVVIHDVPEFVRVHQADEVILIGHHQRGVNGIHPFDGSLHRPAAVQHAGRWVDLIDPLRRNSRFRKRGEILFFCEEVKVCHTVSPLPFVAFVSIPHSLRQLLSHLGHFHCLSD